MSGASPVCPQIFLKIVTISDYNRIFLHNLWDFFLLICFYCLKTDVSDNFNDENIPILHPVSKPILETHGCWSLSQLLFGEGQSITGPHRDIQPHALTIMPIGMV